MRTDKTKTLFFVFVLRFHGIVQMLTTNALERSSNGQLQKMISIFYRCAILNAKPSYYVTTNNMHPEVFLVIEFLWLQTLARQLPYVQEGFPILNSKMGQYFLENYVQSQVLTSQ